MEGDTSAPTNGGLVSGSAPAVASPPSAFEEPKTGQVAAMSGALQGQDAKDMEDATKPADDAEGT